MPSLNKVFLMGNLTREPELRYTPNGSPVCDLGLAVSRKFTQNGQEREDVCFVDVTVWEKQAEACGKFLQKGSPVFVEGRLQYDQWIDKDQNKRSRLRVQAERIQFLGVRRDNNGGEGDGSYGQRRQMPQNGGYNGYSRQDNGNTGFYNRRSNAGGYQPQPQQGIPPQMPAPEYDAQPSYDDDPTRMAQPRRQMSEPVSAAQAAVPPPPPPPAENEVSGIEDDIPF